MARQAADAAALIGHPGLRDVVVVEWSMGAMVAWKLMRAYPALPLAAIDMTPHRERPAAFTQAWPARLQASSR